MLLQAPAILVSLGDWNMHFLVVIETEYFVTSCWSNVSHFHWFQEKKNFYRETMKGHWKMQSVLLDHLSNVWHVKVLSLQSFLTNAKKTGMIILRVKPILSLKKIDKPKVVGINAQALISPSIQICDDSFHRICKDEAFWYLIFLRLNDWTKWSYC